MPVTELRIEGYRSVRALTLPLKRANIVLGPNGCGKSNLYQAISLLRHAAAGTLAKALGDEGGMPSVLWAGPRKSGPVLLKLGVSLDEYDYELVLGLPQTTFYGPNLPSQFVLDPHVKGESLVRREGRGKLQILDRGASRCSLWRVDGSRDEYTLALHHGESVLDQIVNPRDYPLLDDFRRRLLKWRFYHGFRADADSPLRKGHVGVRTYVLAGDGFDLAAALQTIRENGDGEGLRAAVDDAFPGAWLRIEVNDGVFEVSMAFPGVERPMRARELSDGTLRYLCLLAALLSPSAAPLLALNEPETSLSEDLMPALARLIARAAATSQIWLTTHSHRLSEELSSLLGVVPLRLEKVEGETLRAGRPSGAAFSAEWDT
ncbi:MAG: AAA family ATPase [Fimbriimonas sp.]